MSTEVHEFPYETHLDLYYGPAEVVDVPVLVTACKHPWYNQSLCRVNGSVIRLGVLQGEYHWHRHSDDDEFFLVLEGIFYVDLEDRVIELRPWQGFMVSKGVVHRTRAPQRCVVLMVENAGIVPTGN